MLTHSTTLTSVFPFDIQNRWLWKAEIIFTLVFLIFLKRPWFFLNYLYYRELSHTVLQNYRIAAFVNR